ncbi:MAG: hypothetical protein IKX56_03930 [Muribaculaceae bacterium]|nr:hypothetical protein [Muribaculaceae bacterium]
MDFYKPKTAHIMEQAIVINPRVVDRLCFMSPEERRLIFETLIADEVLKEQRVTKLTPEQELTYLLVRDMIMRDSMRCSAMIAQQSASIRPVVAMVS